MLRTMVNEFNKAGFDVIASLNRKLKPLIEWLDADVYDKVDEALNRRPDAALVIAPETGGELERITTKLMKKGIPVLGSRGRAIRISADKWLTYLALKGKVPQPETWRRPPNARGRILTKPIDGVGCEGIGFLPSHRRRERTIFQEFLSGGHASCCLLMGKSGGAVLSVNRQEILINGGRFEYRGSEVPLKHELSEMCARIALRAAESLNLRGYCGVDLVVGRIPHVIEINPRPTTSFIALAQVLRANLGELLVNTFVDGSPPSRAEVMGHSIVKILKVKRDIRINGEKFDELREIPGVVAPPLAFDGYLREGSSMLMAGSGDSARSAERELATAIEEAFALLGVDRDAVTWP